MGGPRPGGPGAGLRAPPARRDQAASVRRGRPAHLARTASGWSRWSPAWRWFRSPASSGRWSRRSPAHRRLRRAARSGASVLVPAEVAAAVSIRASRGAVRLAARRTLRGGNAPKRRSRPVPSRRSASGATGAGTARLTRTEPGRQLFADDPRRAFWSWTTIPWIPRDGARTILGQQGHVVSVAGDAQGALAFALKAPPRPDHLDRGAARRRRTALVGAAALVARDGQHAVHLPDRGAELPRRRSAALPEPSTAA